MTFAYDPEVSLESANHSILVFVKLPWARMTVDFNTLWGGFFFGTIDISCGQVKASSGSGPETSDNRIPSDTGEQFLDSIFKNSEDLQDSARTGTPPLLGFTTGRSECWFKAQPHFLCLEVSAGFGPAGT